MGVVTSAGGDISGDDPDASGGKAKNNSFFISFNDHENIFNVIIILSKHS